MAQLEELQSNLADAVEDSEARVIQAIRELKLSSAQPGPRRMRLEAMTAQLQELDEGDVQRLDEVLGQGSFGVVHKGMFQRQPVAIKTLNNMASLNPKSVQLFKREAAVMQTLDHPNVIRIWGMGNKAKTGSMFICLEFGDLGTLSKYLYGQEEGFVFDVSVLTGVCQDMSAGLTFALAKNVKRRIHNYLVYNVGMIGIFNLIVLGSSGGALGMMRLLDRFTKQF